MDYQDNQDAFGRPQDSFGQPPPDPFAEPKPGNAWGTLGLWFGVLQIFTCGLLSPLGLLFSLIGLRKEPRQNAYIGLGLNGILGLMVLLPVAITLIAVGGIGYFARNAAMDFAQTRMELDQARQVILNQARQDKTLPTTEEGNQLLTEYLGDTFPLTYELDGNNYTISSAGPDGKFGTIDDGEVSGRQMPDGQFIITDKLRGRGGRAPLD